MGTFEITRSVHADPATLWRVVTDWAGYADWMPLTRMQLDDGPTRVGYGFAGVSGVGPLSFADSMVVTHWQPPTDAGAGEFRVRKTGRVLAGWAAVTVAPGPDGASLRWVEDITVRPRPVGRLLAPVADRVNRAMFGRAVDAMVARAEKEAGGVR
ncbi:MAG: SRPBCC family protein [Oryzihumus sp.]